MAIVYRQTKHTKKPKDGAFDGGIDVFGDLHSF